MIVLHEGIKLSNGDKFNGHGKVYKARESANFSILNILGSDITVKNVTFELGKTDEILRYCIFISGPYHRIRFENVRCVCSSDEVSVQNGVLIEQATRVFFEDFEVFGSQKGYGFVLRNVAQAIIQGGVIHSNTYEGIKFSAGLATATIRDNLIEYNGGKVSGSDVGGGISLGQGGVNVKILNNTIRNNRSHGITVKHKDQKVFGNLISGNTIEDNKNHGINHHGDDRGDPKQGIIEGTRITDNTIRGSSESGIFVSGGCIGIVNNSLEGNNSGINLRNQAKYCRSIGNVIKDSKTWNLINQGEHNKFVADIYLNGGKPNVTGTGEFTSCHGV